MVIRKVNNIDLTRQLKTNNLDAYKQALQQESQTQADARSTAGSKIKWNIRKKR